MQHLTVAGGVKCWGLNYSGELGNNANTETSNPNPAPTDVDASPSVPGPGPGVPVVGVNVSSFPLLVQCPMTGPSRL